MMKKNGMIAIRLLLMVCIIVSTVGTLHVPKAAAADEYDALRAKFSVQITGGLYDPNDSDISAKISSITSNAQNYWNSMNTVTGRTYLWSDLTSITVSSDVTNNYNRLNSMSIAWATDGSSLYHDSGLKDSIISAMDWMYTNRYNENKTSYNNWWDWEIGSPLAIVQITTLLYENLSSTQIANYMNAINHFTPVPKYTGANLAWTAITVAVRGILTKDSTLLVSARDGLSPIFPYVTQYDGFYADGSFLQHLKHPYNGGYGKSLLDTLAPLMLLLNGSTWEVTDPNKQLIFKWVYDAFAPFLYKGSLLSMVRGREVISWAAQEHEAGHALIGAIAMVTQFAPPTDALAFKRMIKAWVTEDTYSSVYPQLSIYRLGIVKSIMNDPAIAPRTEPVFYKNYGSMDRTLQQRPGYAFGISMYSNRIFNYESGNGENVKGWYTGSGMNYLYNGDLTQFSDYYWQTVNPYRLPGTTVDTRIRANAEGQTSLSGSNWVGGTGFEDSGYGVTGMLLNTQAGKLTAQKSWFMFDDEIIALGANVNRPDDTTTTADDAWHVETIVDNRKLNLTGDNALTVDGVAKSNAIGWTEAMNGVNWIHLEGNAAGADMGYYFPSTANLNGLREARSSGINTRNYLNLWYDHGLNPAGDTYSYALLPNKTSTQVADYAANPDFSVLANTSTVQAVKENKLNLTGINFWQDTSTTVGSLTSDKKAAVMMKEYSNAVELAVSDPTEANSGSINFEIAKEAAGVLEADSNITITQLSPTIKFSVAVKGTVGKTFKIKFALNSPSVIQLNPSADSYVVDGSTTNFGTSTNLEAMESDTAGQTRRTYLKFDLSSLTGTGYTAKLRVFGRAVTSGIYSTTQSVYGVDDDSWTETGINWMNKPTVGTFHGKNTFSTTYAWKDYDVTPFVQSQLTGDKTVSLAMLEYDKGSNLRMNSRNNTANKPVLYLIPDQAITSSVTEDAGVRMGSGYSNVNAGSSSILVVKDHWSTERQAYLKFDLSSITSNVNSAKLMVYGILTEGTEATYKAFSVFDNSWNEMGITWDNKPYLEKEIGSATIPYSGAYGWTQIDVTDYVKAQMKKDGIVSMALLEDSPAGGHYLELKSKEFSSTYAPYLIVN